MLVRLMSWGCAAVFALMMVSCSDIKEMREQEMKEAIEDISYEMEDPGRQLKGRRWWFFKAAGSLTTEPAVEGGVVYLSTENSYLQAVSAKSGKELWLFDAACGRMSAPAVAGGLVFVGCQDGTVHAVYAKRGVVKWSFKAGGAVEARPVEHDGTLFVGSHDQHLYALKADNGELRWSFTARGAITEPVAIAGQEVYMASRRGRVMSLWRFSGEERWRHDAGSAVTTQVAVGDGLIFFGTADGQLHCLSQTNGEPVWKGEVGRDVLNPSVRRVFVFAGSAEGFLLSVIAREGKQRWAFRAGQRLTSFRQNETTRVYAGGSDGSVFTVDWRTGSGRPWEQRVPAEITAPPVLWQGALYVVSRDGTLTAFR